MAASVYVRIALVLLVLVVVSIGVFGGARAIDYTTFEDGFATDPFANPARWSRLEAACVDYVSASAHVVVGDYDDPGGCGTAILTHPEETTSFSATEADDLRLSFIATFREESGATGGPTVGWIGFKEDAGLFGQGDVVALRALSYHTPNCVAINAFFFFSDATQQGGTESACSLSFDVAYSGLLAYDGSSGTLTVTLASLEVSIVATPGKTLVLEETGFYEENPIVAEFVVDDVEYELGTAPAPPGGPPDPPLVPIEPPEGDFRVRCAYTWPAHVVVCVADERFQSDAIKRRSWVVDGEVVQAIDFDKANGTRLVFRPGFHFLIPGRQAFDVTYRVELLFPGVRLSGSTTARVDTTFLWIVYLIIVILAAAGSAQKVKRRPMGERP